MINNKKRNMEIYNLKNEGKTYKEIAIIYKLTPERIRQIWYRVDRQINYIKTPNLNIDIDQLCDNMYKISNSNVDEDILKTYIDICHYDRNIVSEIAKDFNISIYSNDQLDEKYFSSLDSKVYNYNYTGNDYLKRLEPYGFISNSKHNDEMYIYNLIEIDKYFEIYTINELVSVLGITDSINNYKREYLINKLQNSIIEKSDILRLVDALIIYLNNDKIKIYGSSLKYNILKEKLNSALGNHIYLDSIYKLVKAGHLKEFVKPINKPLYKCITVNTSIEFNKCFYDSYTTFTDNLEQCKKECNNREVAPLGYPQFLYDIQHMHSIITLKHGVYVDIVELKEQFKLDEPKFDINKYRYFCIYDKTI